MSYSLALTRRTRTSVWPTPVGRGHRHDEAPADRELIEERLRHDGTARRDRGRVVGRVLGPAERAVTVVDVDVAKAEAREAFARLLREPVDPLDRVDLARDAPENGGRIAGARPDLEHALSCLELERLYGPRDDVRL